MADNNPAKRAPEDHIPNDDPMLELTRIMGVTPPVEADPEPDAFGIDLEREMLGEADPGGPDAAGSTEMEPVPGSDDLGQEAADALQLSEDDLQLPELTLDDAELAVANETVSDLEQQVFEETAQVDARDGDADSLSGADTGWDDGVPESGEFLLDDDLSAAGPEIADEPELRESLAAALDDLPPADQSTHAAAGEDPVLDQMLHHDGAGDAGLDVDARAADFEAYQNAEPDLDQTPIAELKDDGFDWPEAADIHDTDAGQELHSEETSGDGSLERWSTDEPAATGGLDSELAGLLADIGNNADDRDAEFQPAAYGNEMDVPAPDNIETHAEHFSPPAEVDSRDAALDAPDEHDDGLALDAALLDDELLADLDTVVLQDDALTDEPGGEFGAHDGAGLHEQAFDQEAAEPLEHEEPVQTGWEEAPAYESDMVHPDDGAGYGTPHEAGFEPSGESDDRSVGSGEMAAAAVAGGALAAAASWNTDAAAVGGGARYESDDIPAFDTHEIAEEATMLQDDLAIPDLNDGPELPRPDASGFVEDVPASLPADDLQPPQEASQLPLQDDFESFFFEEMEAQNKQAAERGDQWSESDVPAAPFETNAGVDDYLTPQNETSPEFFGAAGAAHGAEQQAGSADNDSRKRGVLIAAVVAGVVVIGGVGAFALSSGDDPTSGAEPALVRADADPVKVKPEDPGGTTIPNQDKEVYQRVAGQSADEEPAQQRLVTTAEEPVDVAAKSEERVSPSQVADEPSVDGTIAAVTPRRVRTMIVRADGTLVPREDVPAEAPAASPAAEEAPAIAAVTPSQPPAATQTPAPTAGEQASQPVAAVLPAEPATGEAEETVDLEFPPTAPRPTPRSEAIAASAQQSVARAATQQTAPSGPLVESRPADQPITIVGQTGGTQTAAAQAPAAAAATATPPAWVQISSQPSRELAQSSYANLSQRYASIIGGRGVNIVAAEIPGRGTFYRVNIPADDLRQASQMCGRIKAAGGDCLPRRQRAQ